MNMRFARSMLVMFVVVTLAGALQDIVPPLPPANVKAPFLLGVVAYYGMRRELRYGVLAAVWCGLLLDGMSALPWGASLLSFGVYLAACHLLFRPQMSDGALSCMVTAVAGGLLADATSYAALIGSGRYAPLPFSFLAIRVLSTGVASFVAAGAVAGFARHLDCMSSNAGFEREDEAFGWNSN